jgi:hypothetical protein
MGILEYALMVVIGIVIVCAFVVSLSVVLNTPQMPVIDIHDGGA